MKDSKQWNGIIKFVFQMHSKDRSACLEVRAVIQVTNGCDHN